MVHQVKGIHTWVSIKKWVGFSSNTLASSLFHVTSLLLGLTQVFVAHQFTIVWLVERMMLSLFLFLSVSVHKCIPLSHIKARCSIVATTFQWCTPSILVMPLTDDAPSLALTTTVRMQCLASNLTLKLTCFVSTREIWILATNFWVVTIAFGGKNNQAF